MTPRFPSLLFALALALAFTCVAAANDGKHTKPNVIVILADDLGIVDMNAYAARFTGAKPSEMFYETPNLDRLVKEGMAFSQAYACHLCSPARASLLTGKYAARTGFTTAVGGNVRTFYNQAIEPPQGYVAQDALVWQDKIEIQQALLNGTTRDALASGQPSDHGAGNRRIKVLKRSPISTRAVPLTSIGAASGTAANCCFPKHLKRNY